nr:hypothetical protein [Burkholderia pyrrocinia]
MTPSDGLYPVMPTSPNLDPMWSRESTFAIGIAERNSRRYRDTHGYTFYVHRDIPAEIELNATGSRFKPWLLHAYLQHHEWVV